MKETAIDVSNDFELKAKNAKHKVDQELEIAFAELCCKFNADMNNLSQQWMHSKNSNVEESMDQYL